VGFKRETGAAGVTGLCFRLWSYGTVKATCLGIEKPRWNEVPSGTYPSGKISNSVHCV
jgi:hypothetical protein